MFRKKSSVETTSAVSRRKKSLVVDFSVKLGFFIVVIFVALSVLSVRSVSNGTKKNYTDTVEGLIPVFADSVTQWTQRFIYELDIYAKSDIVRTGNDAEIVEWLQRMADRRSDEFSTVTFIDLSGQGVNDFGQNFDLSDRDYVKAVLDGGHDKYISNPITSRFDSSLVFQVCVAAYNAQRQKIGLFAASVSLDSLQKKVEQIKVGEKGYLAVVDGNGVSIVDPDENLHMQNLAQNADKSLSELAGRLINRETGTGTVTTDRYGKCSVSFTPVPETPWSAIIVIPESQVNETAVSLGRSIAIECLAFAVLLILINGLMILASIRPLKTVDTAVNTIASGNADLTQRIQQTINNEIGSVVAGFNNFIAKLQSIIADVKASKDELSKAGTGLQDSMKDNEAAVSQIITSIDSVNNEITNQSASVEETAGAVTQISQNIVSLDKMIETQASGITEASAAVEEMIGNIGGVNQSVEKMASSFNELEERAQNGSEKQERVREQIEKISGQSEMLEDANAAIASIASQTNLLAMNAAIEAAHAGEAGKGFSVVADEIRKLSETSTVQSKTIGEQLKKIRDSIGSVVTESGASSEAFASVSGKINETNTLVVQIKGAMAEQLSGSKQINEALHIMNDSTSEVRSASAEMSDGQKAILEEVRRLQEATTAMKERITEMSQSAQKINGTGKTLNSISRDVEEAIDRIGSQIDQFKV
ncbi:MAG: methyl-accepting chemotaxis protein [Treponema sp.]|jgi:methyl-accepting chemotaxis protein|nr:methyl-accepting chemotaxis protein [Treponema sp.]